LSDDQPSMNASV